MNNYMLIGAMALVTMTPRILPFFAFDADKLPPVMKRFLDFIPFTVLGALILPGGIEGIGGHPLLSALCLVLAGLIAWLKNGIILPVMGAVVFGVLALQFGLL